MPFARAEAFAPASMGNVGVAFDIMGLAFREPGDTVRVEWNDAPGVEIAAIEGDGGRLPRDPAQNSASVAATSVLKQLAETRGLRLTLIKDLPLASGLGSSAASAVAAAVAVNALCGEPLSRADLLPACLDGEAAVSGYHVDNVGPSLIGGITLITGVEFNNIFHLPVPENLHCALVTPDVEVPTAKARAVLPSHITLRDFVAQTGAVARLVDALHHGDLHALAAAMESDRIIEPARAHLIPMLDDARAAAKRAGALGLVISGAGPTLCAVCDTPARAKRVAAALGAVYDSVGIDNLTRHTRVCPDGARVLSVA
jgi:homoserine kinase